MALRVHENSSIHLCKHNLNLPISHKDHYPYKNYYHSVFNLQQSSPEALQSKYSIRSSILHTHILISRLVLSPSGVQILYGLQIDDIRQCVQLELSRTSSWSMISILDSLHRFSVQFIKNGSAAI